MLRTKSQFENLNIQTTQKDDVGTIEKKLKKQPNVDKLCVKDFQLELETEDDIDN